MPGKRKSKGEMLFEAWMPLQPAANANKATSAIERNHFQFQCISGTVEAVQRMATMISRKLCFMFLPTVRAAICSAAMFALPGSVLAQSNSLASRSERAFSEAQQIVRKEPTNTAALVALARAAFDWAEFARKDSQRADIANAGIEAARRTIEICPTNAAAHYWLGMDLGQLARTKSLGALKLVREMEDEFHRALNFDPHVDFAGPDRSLGLLYRDAPGWPTSIGSKKKAREHLERAVQLHPEFLENQLALLESFEKWADRQNFDRQMKATERAYADAKTKFTGSEWEPNWTDWKQRLAEMKSKSGEVGKHTPSKGAK